MTDLDRLKISGDGIYFLTDNGEWVELGILAKEFSEPKKIMYVAQFDNGLPCSDYDYNNWLSDEVHETKEGCITEITDDEGYSMITTVSSNRKDIDISFVKHFGGNRYHCARIIELEVTL